MNQFSLSTTRHFFAQCVFMDNIHYKAYYRLANRQNLYRKIMYWISGITLLLIISKVIAFEANCSPELLKTILSTLSFIGIILTATSLMFSFFQKEDLSEIKIQHRITAEAYKELRDGYLLLIEEVLSDISNENELRDKSKDFQMQYSYIGKSAPTTTYEDYESAQKGLGLSINSDEEYTWSDTEINRFLPEKLRI